MARMEEYISNRPIERILSNQGAEIIMVRRGMQPPEALSFFGAGGWNKTFPDPYNTVESIAEVTTGSANSPYLFGVYNTDQSFSLEAALADSENFLSTNLATSYIESLATAASALNRRRVLTTYESYSGGLFLAVLTAALKNPDHASSISFFSSMNAIGDRVVVMAPAIVASNSSKFKLSSMLHYAKQKNPNIVERKILEVAGLSSEVKKMNTGSFFHYDYETVLKQFVTRFKHLPLFEKVFRDNVKNLTIPDGIQLPEIIVIHHIKDQELKYGPTRKAMKPLEKLKVLIFREAKGFVGKDKHCLYATPENRKPLHDLIFS